MRAALVALLLLGSTGPALAMGTDVSIDLVAWNADGTAALLHTSTSFDGDTTDLYSVVGVGDKPELAVQIAGSSSHVQTVDLTECAKAMAALAKSIAAHKFAGVTLRPDRCGVDKRDDAVTTSPSVTAAAKASIISNPGTTSRDKQIWAAFKTATSTDIPANPDPNTDYPSAEIATKNGKLVIALFTPSRGFPIRTQLLAFVPAKDGFAPLAI